MSRKIFIIIMSVILIFNVKIAKAAVTDQIDTGTSDVQNVGLENSQTAGQSQKPIMHYYGYGIIDAKEFEIAHALFFEHKGSDTTNKFKKPAGTIQLGKQMLFIVEATIETEEAKLESANQNQQTAVQDEQGNQTAQNRKKPAISQIKSCVGKISSSYYERPLNPPEPGQTTSEVAPAGTANIIGNINLESVEKEAGNSKKKVICGTMNVNSQIYNIYLDPRVLMPKRGMQGGQQMPPPPPRGRGGNGQQNGGTQTGTGGNITE